MNEAVQNIVIVGGGTAGWITAGTLAAKLKNKFSSGYSITLVESAAIPTIGVGEGTWPTMRNTLKNMGVRETDFIRECHVSFKQGAKFAQWTTGHKNDFYYHPLVLPQDHESIDLVPHWQDNHAEHSFSNMVCPQETLCELGLAPKQIITPEFAAVANYAYHLDAGTFSEFLKKHCIEKLKVKHIIDDVIQVNSQPNGDIASVATQSNGDITGDLFIDCTGFSSLLLGQHLNVKFVSCKDSLFTDKAIAVQVPYPDENSEIQSHTLSTAQAAGWVWDIGLSSRRGVGHVYSSQHMSADHAHQALLNYLTPSVNNPDALNFREISFDAGHREKFWHKNCVAIGLSAGFLEPLEASALLLIEISAQMVADQLPANRVAMDIVAKRYNKTFIYRWQRIIDFLKLHYTLSQRTDNSFWQDHRDPSTLSEQLKEQLELWRYHFPCDGDFESALEVFPAASYQYVLYGMGFKTQPNAFGLAEQNKAAAQAAFIKNAQQTQQFQSILSSNRELLNKIHQYGLQRI
ncbi:tryptophan halogenase family protein [Algibacillus agarilyticus]|uniref:tryptophan halogenase family protein n=1 Tax=Algibacillus agarilyticus TaxID=2234133 RepID=UPI000DD08550|nr:tryptophan halogenase family protein [Algibacillus agarilyticus]